MAARARVLSGMRPTGRLHIGHYFGALQNWIRMQDEYDCFYFVADWHALTSDYADTSQVAQNTIEIGIDWLAAGLDPAKCTMFVQSEVPEHAELHLLLSMVTPLSILEQVPTYREQIENVKDKDLRTYGFLGYPLLQTADIVMYGRPDAELFVPVGEDQVPHVEMSREIVRRCNDSYGLQVSERLYGAENGEALRRVLASPPLGLANELARPLFLHSGTTYPLSAEAKSYFTRRIKVAVREIGIENFFELHPEFAKWITYKRILQEPQVWLTETPRLPGTDGRKMSKSYNNYILLSEDDASIRLKARNMMTDPARKRRTDKGNPDVCPVFSWHKIFSPPETIAWSNHGCRTAEIGCIECKSAMADYLVKWIEPIRARRTEYEAQPARVLKILDAGTRRAGKVAAETMERVREATLGYQALRREILAGAGKPSAAGG